MAPVSTIESSTRLRRSIARSGWRKGFSRFGLWIMPGQQRALRKVELAHILAEVGLRRLAESVDGKAAALPEIDLVGVHLEDLLLA